MTARTPKAKRKPGRPRAAAGNDTRQALLDAARAVLAEGGMAAFSAEAVARKAKVDPAMINYHFGTKRGLLMAITNHLIGGWLAEARTLMTQDATAADKLRQRLLGLAEMRRDAPFIDRHILESIISSEDEVAEAYRDYTREAVRQYQDILEAGAKAGDLRPVDPAFFFTAILGLFDFLFSFQTLVETIDGGSRPRGDMARRYTEQVVDLVLFGVAARPGAAKPRAPRPAATRRGTSRSPAGRRRASSGS